jgi:hypothetical protein
MRRRLLLLLPWAALLAGCGYIGAPLPPSLHIPEKIADLAAFERGDKLVIDFTAPAVTTDGVALRILGEIDLRCGPAGPQWEQTARRIEVAAAQPGPVHVESPARDWTGKVVELRVRASARRGRTGAWSNAIRLKAIPPLEPPVLKALAVAEGVRLTWTGSNGAQYRIYRLAPLEPKPSLVATAQRPEYTDAQTQYGKTYQYSVEAFVPSGDSEARSEVSQTAAITPEDRFPPAVPGGLAALAGVSAIELSWNPDTDADLRGYYVYRSVAGGPFARVGELVETPAYSDHAVESGKRYSYAVSAVDQAGNESARAAAVEIVAP